MSLPRVLLAGPGEGTEREDLAAYFTDPDVVLARLRRELEETWYGGEAFPVLFPVSVRLVAILSKYLGAPNGSRRPPLVFDPDNEWFRISRRLLEAAVEWAAINRAWLEAWRAVRSICHRLGGWFFWMRLWSDEPAVDLQSDVSCLVSREHFPLERRILAAGKRLVLDCEPGEVRTLLRELEPAGLMLSTRCASEQEARDLLAGVPGWARRGRGGR